MESYLSYWVTRREIFAVVHFAHYFRGKGYFLKTDHGLLTWPINFREPEGQLARWLESHRIYDIANTV